MNITYYLKGIFKINKIAISKYNLLFNSIYSINYFNPEVSNLKSIDYNTFYHNLKDNIDNNTFVISNYKNIITNKDCEIVFKVEKFKDFGNDKVLLINNDDVSIDRMYLKDLSIIKNNEKTVIQKAIDYYNS